MSATASITTPRNSDFSQRQSLTRAGHMGCKTRKGYMDSMGQAGRVGRVVLLATLAVTLWGCEIDSFFDQSNVGRWERTPVQLPILSQLDVIDEPQEAVEGLTPVRPEDLIPEVREYVAGPGDGVTFSVFELVVPNVEWNQGRRVDELGLVRLPVLGTLSISGFTASQLEVEIAELLERKGILKDPTVSVTIVEQRQNTFSVIGEPSTASTAIGTYQILRPDFRLLDAMALARGVPGRTKKLFVIRQVQAGDAPKTPSLIPQENPGQEGGLDGSDQGSSDPADLIDSLMLGIDEPTVKAPAPAALEAGIEDQDGSSPWVNIDGKWVKLDAMTLAARDAPEGTSIEDIHVSQRIVEIPYDRLLQGDMRYNVVIRPGDIIRVPPAALGNVYAGGQISRPGTYGLPGDRDLTLKQLIISAGGLNGVAIPNRVDLTRRIGADREATVRLNLKAIFDGTQPDIFLKPNDTINVGTNFFASHLASMRNSFRFSYGFGFILDRNFDRAVFGRR